MPNRAGRIDQIVFRWRARSQTSHDGVGPDATSLADADVRWWEEKLALRITRASGGNDRPALSYLRFDGQAVILHKVPARDDKNRPGAAVAHALIGADHLVNVNLALGLEDWTGWAGRQAPEAYPPGRLAGLDHEELREWAGAALSRPCADPGPVFDQLLSRVLAGPGAPLTVVLPDAPATTLVRGLVEVLGGEPGHDWTFATNEDDDTDPGLPRLVFLDAVSGGTGYAATRHRLFLGSAGPPADFAQQLADAWRRGGPGAIEPLRGRRSLTGAAEVRQWQHDVTVGGRILRTTLVQAVALNQADPEHLAVLETEEGVRQLKAELNDKLSDGELKAIYQAWQPGGPLAATYPQAAAMVARYTVQRCMRASAGAGLSEALRGSPFDVAMVDKHLEAWAANGRNVNATPSAIIELAQRAVSFGVPPALRWRGMRAILDRLTLAQLIEQANRHTNSDVHITELLLSAAEDRAHDPSALDAAHMALERTDYLIYCIPFLPGDPQIAQDRWHRVLWATFGPALGTEERRSPIYQILDFLARDGAPEVPPTLVFALRRFPSTLAGKASVDQLAARERYLEAGLPDIWPERRELRTAARPQGAVARAPSAAPAGAARPIPPAVLVVISSVLAVALVAVVIFGLVTR